MCRLPKLPFASVKLPHKVCAASNARGRRTIVLCALREMIFTGSNERQVVRLMGMSAPSYQVLTTRFWAYWAQRYWLAIISHNESPARVCT